MKRFAKGFSVWISAVTLGLFLDTANAEADICQDPPASPTETRKQEFERRMKMIEALEVSRDDARLSCLVRADTHLESYYVVMRRASVSLQDPALVRKLLDLPVLDKGAENYRSVIGSVFAEIAANNTATKPDIKQMLIDSIKDDQETKDEALRHIFQVSAMNTARDPDIELTRQLVKTGASVEKAIARARERILNNEHPDIRHDLDKMDRFYQRLVSAAP